MRAPRPLIPALCFGVLCGIFVHLATAQNVPPKKKAVPPLSAERLLEQSDYDSAETLLKAQIIANPSDSHAITLFAQLRENQHLYRKAEALYREALRADPTSAEAAESLIKLYTRERRIDEAIVLAEPWHKAAPANDEVKILLGSLYEKRRMFVESLALCEGLLTTPLSHKVLAVVITDRMMLGQGEQVQPLIAELLRSAAAEPQLVPELATSLMRNGMTTDAAELLRVASPKLKSTAGLLAAMAEAEGRQGHLSEAAQLAERARKVDENSTEALIVSGQIAARQSDWKATAGFFKRALETGPPDITVVQGLTYAYMQDGNVDEAHSAAELLYSLQPDSADAALSLALVDVRGKHWGESVPLLDRVLSKRPSDKPAHLAKGIAKYQLGDLDAAVQHLTASLGEAAADGDAHYYLGLVAKQRGDLAAATTEMEAAIKADTENQQALSSLGQLYAQQGKLELARGVLEKAIVKSPDDAQGHYQLATVYRRLSMTDKAKEQLEIYQRLIAKTPPVKDETAK